MTIVRVCIHNEVIDAIQVQFAVGSVKDRLRNHLGVAVLRLDMRVFILTEVDTMRAYQERRGEQAGRLEAGLWTTTTQC